jgi:hypothetical protein
LKKAIVLGLAPDSGAVALAALADRSIVSVNVIDKTSIERPDVLN